MEATQPTNPPTFESVWAALQETAKQHDRDMKALRESQKETDRIVKENARQMGALHNRFGELKVSTLIYHWRRIGYTNSGSKK